MIAKHKKAPGQKFIKKLDLVQLTWMNSIGGVVLFSLGQCLFALSWIRVYQGYDKTTWVTMIIFGLLITLIGIFLLGQAMIAAAERKAKKLYKKRYKSLLKRQSKKLAGQQLMIGKK